MVGLDRPGFEQIASTTDEETEEAFERAATPDVEALVQVGTGLPVLHLVETLQRRFERPIVASNLAVSLAKTGAKVGLCDCDLYGPSVAMRFGTDERPMANDKDEIIPVEVGGVKLMSMGFLLEDRSPVIVRGPMATRYTQ